MSHVGQHRCVHYCRKVTCSSFCCRFEDIPEVIDDSLPGPMHDSLSDSLMDQDVILEMWQAPSRALDSGNWSEGFSMDSDNNQNLSSSSASSS
jgi:hypothetical protein